MAKNNIDLSVVLHDTSDYKDWLVELKERFYSHRLKASCATNGYLLDFYWKLGRDIEAKQYANTYGSGFYKNLSQDLKNEMPGVKGFSPINLRYMNKFFKLYAPLYRNIPQTAELFSDSLSDSNVPQVAEQSEKRQQPVDDFKMLFSIPWDHHRRIIDKCKDDMDKALFFARKTWENNWGRDALLNWLDTDLYERDGKAVTNFQSTLSAVQSDLAQQMTSAVNHQFKTDIDNPTIGLLICKDKDNVVAKYALDSYKEPMGISEYQLSKLFPKDFKSSMPTIEELEKGLKDNRE